MPAFLLTWKESGWPHGNIVRMARQFESEGYVDEPWRIFAYRMAKLGDRVWVLRQGRGRNGIFGAGHITGQPSPGIADGKMHMMAPVRFEAFVDPEQQLLIGEEAIVGILNRVQIRAQASGYPITDEQSAALEQLLPARPVREKADWTLAELQAIVADYLAMLRDELAGHAYSKTEHRNALRKVVHRSPGSIERKHQNISAVLQELGLPWINGYKPLGNWQDALVGVLEARLDGFIDDLDQAVPRVAPPPVNVAGIFVPPPSPSDRSKGPSINQVIRKPDAATRDAANHALGRAGEEYVVRLEQRRLEELGREDLAAKVSWVADQIGDGLGYDIESFADDGNPLFIEVKTTRGPITTPFLVSENERRVAAEKRSAFRIYRLFGFGTDPRVYALCGPLEPTLKLEPIAYRARVA